MNGVGAIAVIECQNGCGPREVEKAAKTSQ